MENDERIIAFLLGKKTTSTTTEASDYDYYWPQVDNDFHTNIVVGMVHNIMFVDHDSLWFSQYQIIISNYFYVKALSLIYSIYYLRNGWQINFYKIETS